MKLDKEEYTSMKQLVQTGYENQKLAVLLLHGKGFSNKEITMFLLNHSKCEIKPLISKHTHTLRPTSLILEYKLILHPKRFDDSPIDRTGYVMIGKEFSAGNRRQFRYVPIGLQFELTYDYKMSKSKEIAIFSKFNRSIKEILR